VHKKHTKGGYEMAEKKASATRINFNVTERQKKEMQKKAKEVDKNLTDYILYQCLDLDPTKEKEIVILDLNYKLKEQIFKVEQYQQTIEQLKQDKEELKQEQDALRLLNQEANRVIQWHSLGWFKKMITKSIENK
jgi:uncharacterized protein (DUF1778 family)